MCRPPPGQPFGPSRPPRRAARPPSPSLRAEAGRGTEPGLDHRVDLSRFRRASAFGHREDRLAVEDHVEALVGGRHEAHAGQLARPIARGPRRTAPVPVPAGRSDRRNGSRAGVGADRRARSLLPESSRSRVMRRGLSPRRDLLYTSYNSADAPRGRPADLAHPSRTGRNEAARLRVRQANDDRGRRFRAGCEWRRGQGPRRRPEPRAAAQLPARVAWAAGRPQPDRRAVAHHARGERASRRGDDADARARDGPDRRAALPTAGRGGALGRARADPEPRHGRWQPRPRRSRGRGAGDRPARRRGAGRDRARRGAAHPGRRVLPGLPLHGARRGRDPDRGALPAAGDRFALGLPRVRPSTRGLRARRSRRAAARRPRTRRATPTEPRTPASSSSGRRTGRADPSEPRGRSWPRAAPRPPSRMRRAWPPRMPPPTTRDPTPPTAGRSPRPWCAVPSRTRHERGPHDHERHAPDRAPRQRRRAPRGRRAAPAAVGLPAPLAAPDRDPRRLRARRLRRLHGAGRRAERPLVPDVRGPGRTAPASRRSRASPGRRDRSARSSRPSGTSTACSAASARRGS